MPDLTARLGLPVLAPAQAQKHVTHNEALQRLDGVVQTVLMSVGGQTPPVLPVAGEIHALGPAPTGAWSGQAGQLAQWQFDQWQFIAPEEGWRAWDLTAGVMRVYRAGGWAEQLQNVAGLGIGTTSDAQNRLAVISPASLFSHAGASHQLKINKAGAGDFATVLYQADWNGHAEMGLAGDNDFHIKTSSDGSNWTEALVIDAASGTLSGAAVQTTAVDTTAGRLMTVGGFGLGNVTEGPREIGNSDATNTPEGTWAFGPVTSGVLPPGFAGQSGQIRVERYNVTSLRQTASRKDMLGGAWVRACDEGSWGPWRQVVDSANLLGTVSQSGGVPTGAVIERGSNADGEYIRFADGTQICLKSGASLIYFSGDTLRYLWTFPAAFSAGSYVVSAALSSSNGDFTGCNPRDFGAVRHGTGAAETSVDIGSPVATMTASSEIANVRLMATGRWV